MPTEEELEQRVTDSLDKEYRDARDAIRNAERLNEIFNKGGDDS